MHSSHVDSYRYCTTLVRCRATMSCCDTHHQCAGYSTRMQSTRITWSRRKLDNRYGLQSTRHRRTEESWRVSVSVRKWNHQKVLSFACRPIHYRMRELNAHYFSVACIRPIYTVQSHVFTVFRLHDSPMLYKLGEYRYDRYDVSRVAYI